MKPGCGASLLGLSLFAVAFALQPTPPALSGSARTLSARLTRSAVSSTSASTQPIHGSTSSGSGSKPSASSFSAFSPGAPGPVGWCPRSKTRPRPKQLTVREATSSGKNQRLHKTLRGKVREGDDVRDVDDKDDQASASPALMSIIPASLILAVAASTLESNVDLMSFTHSIDLRSIDLRGLLESAVDRVEDLGPLGYLYFSIVYILAEVLALPAIPLTASAGYLFGAVPGTLTVLSSATIAAGISFLIGRTFLRGWVEDVASDNKTFQAIDAAVAREGFKIVLLLRLSPLFPFALSNYLYGLTAVEFGPYLVATLLGFAPGTFAYVYTGEAAKTLSGGAGAMESPYQPLVYAGGLLLLIAFSKTITDIAKQALKDIEEQDETGPRRK